MTDHIDLQATVPDSMSGERFDAIAAQLFPDFSRGRLQTWIKSGALALDGTTSKAKVRAFTGQRLTLQAELESQGEWLAQDIPIDIVYEDEHILVVNKSAGMVVHPAVGNLDGTLLNALLFHCADQEKVPRAGIVHRLDKDTTGLMVVAKTLQAQTNLVSQLQARSVSRQYLALTQGVITRGGSVVEPIGRHPTHRTKMAVVNTDKGKEAITHYEVEESFSAHTLLQVKLETGRTHQIRVHMAHLGYSLVGDATYGGREKRSKKLSPLLSEAIKGFPRQALHAQRLELIHPASGELIAWQAPIPDDMVQLLEIVREDSAL